MTKHCRVAGLVALVVALLAGGPGTSAAMVLASGLAAGPCDSGAAAQAAPEALGYGFIRSIGAPLVSPVQFSRPTDVAVDSFGNIFVADSGHRLIQKFGPDHVLLNKFRVEGQGEDRFDPLGALAIDGANNVYVSDPINKRIEKFD